MPRRAGVRPALPACLSAVGTTPPGVGRPVNGLGLPGGVSVRWISPRKEKKKGGFVKAVGSSS